MKTSYYPKSPLNISKKLTRLTVTYQLKAFLAILAIFLFFILYFTMVVGLGYLVYFALVYDMGRINKFTVLMKIGAISGSSMLLLFTLKCIFKLKNYKSSNRIELVKNEHSELWNFVHKVCQETGAPKPKSIYADPDVNAYVSYTNSWLSLILPVKKELTIGLGLICCLDLSEFKAVIAHEFGHFAQRSMRIGSYIMSANTIIHDMVFSRDRWDEILDKWKKSDIRLSAAAWVITPIIWLIRQILNLFYQFLNIMYYSLSREMEFNADKAAIRISGSDAIISALWKLDGGSENWNSTLNHAYLAAQKNIFIKNLYIHNTLAIDRTSSKQKKLLNNLPDDIRGGKRFFLSSESSKVSMYASHPPNDQRENNAKAPYIESEDDDRSPWLLISSENILQEKMTSILYAQYLNKHPDKFVPSEEFERFISEEALGKDLLKEYYDTFENRFIHIPAPEKLDKEASILQPTYNHLIKIKTDLLEIMKPLKETESLILKIQQVPEETVKEKFFSFNEHISKNKNFLGGYNALLEQRERLLNESFKEWDISFCAFHLALAKMTSRETELINLYKQHDALTKVYKSLVKVKNTIYQELNTIRSGENVTENELNTFGERVKDLEFGLNKEIYSLDHINFVPIPNIDNVKELKEAIVEDGCFRKESGPVFENGRFDRIMNKIENALVCCQRIDQKSIGVILLFHKELQDQLGRDSEHNKKTKLQP